MNNEPRNLRLSIFSPFLSGRWRTRARSDHTRVPARRVQDTRLVYKIFHAPGYTVGPVEEENRKSTSKRARGWLVESCRSRGKETGERGESRRGTGGEGSATDTRTNACTRVDVYACGKQSPSPSNSSAWTRRVRCIDTGNDTIHHEKTVEELVRRRARLCTPVCTCASA